MVSLFIKNPSIHVICCDMIVIQYTWYLKCVAKCKILQDNSCNNSVGVVSEYCVRNADMFLPGT